MKDEGQDYYGMPRSEFNYRKDNGMSSSGPLYREMSFLQACFKYVLPQCRLDELTISSTKLADFNRYHDVDSLEGYQGPR